MRTRTLARLSSAVLGICCLLFISAVTSSACPKTRTEASSGLSVSEQRTAIAIASGDVRVGTILAAGEVTQDSVSVWQMERQSTILGVVVHFAFHEPTNIAATWLLLQYDDDEASLSPYTVESTHQTVSDVSGVNVWVDLRDEEVVAIEPDSTNVVIDDTNESRSPALSDSRVLSATQATNAAESTGPGRATSKLRVVCPGIDLCFYNYDFDSAKPQSYGSKMKRHVDMPVTIIWYQNASHDQVDAVLSGSPSVPFMPATSPARMTARVLNNDPPDQYGHQTKPRWVNVQDGGRKSALCPGLGGRAVHARNYGDANGSLYSPWVDVYSIDWGYTVITTTHEDWQECDWRQSHSGLSEDAESWIVRRLKQSGWDNYTVRANATNLSNKEGWPKSKYSGKYLLHNNGRATLIRVPQYNQYPEE